MIRLVSKKWWVLGLRGLFAIAFGVVAFLWPTLTLAVLVVLFGAYSLADGILTGIAAVAHHREVKRWWLFLLEGIAGVGCGAVALIWPAAVAVALLYLIAAWSLVTGLLEMASGIRLRKDIQGEWLLMLSGVVSVALGVLLIAWPGRGLLALIWLIALYAIIFGALLIALAFRARVVQVE